MRGAVVLSGVLLPLGALLAMAPGALAGGGCHPSGDREPVATSGSSVVVEIDGCVFLPAIDRVPVGTEVTFRNTANGPHDVTGTMWAWQSPTLEPGESFSRTFAEPGTYPFSCSLHPGMAGIIEVGDTDAGLTSSTAPASSDAGAVKADLTPVAAGAFGIALGALASSVVLSRRRSRSG